MNRTWQIVLCLACVCGLALDAALAADFTAAQVEAAREGLQQALDQAVARTFGAADELELQPYIQQASQTVAFVPVETRKEGHNIKISKLATTHRDGALGLDPIVAGKPVNFTLPLKVDAPLITGVFSRKVNDVGPEGNFTTTIGVLRLEAEGTATVTPDACSFTFATVRELEVGPVDSTVEGASLLNSLLSSRVTKAVNQRKLGIGEPLYQRLLAMLQEDASKNDCSGPVREQLKKAPSAPPA